MRELFFRYGRMSSDTCWLQNRDGKYFEVSQETLLALIDIYDGIPPETSEVSLDWSPEERKQLADFILEKKLVAGTGEGRIFEIQDYDSPVPLGGFLALLGGMFCVQWAYLLNVAKHFAVHSLSGLPGVLGLACLGIALHEVGHYWALRPYEKPKLGFCWICFLPAVYVKSDRLWMFSRERRLKVNLMGVFTDSVFNVALIAAAAFWPSLEKWVTPVLMAQYIRWLLLLNPFFHNDGYWILSDLCGVSNIFTKAERSYRDRDFSVFFFYRITQSIFSVIIFVSILLLLHRVFLKLWGGL